MSVQQLVLVSAPLSVQASAGDLVVALAQESAQQLVQESAADLAAALAQESVH